MRVENKVLPSEEQIQGFLEPDAKSPIYMVNLLKFKDVAEYEDGRETELSGRDAYMIYGLAVAELIKKVDGELVFMAAVERLMLGEVEELWDQVAIARYSSRAATLEMMQMPEYQEIAVHRSAGLAGQLNIETVDPIGG